MVGEYFIQFLEQPVYANSSGLRALPDLADQHFPAAAIGAPLP
jgi:hypothetical protein